MWNRNSWLADCDMDAWPVLKRGEQNWLSRFCSKLLPVKGLVDASSVNRRRPSLPATGKNWSHDTWIYFTRKRNTYTQLRVLKAKKKKNLDVEVSRVSTYVPRYRCLISYERSLNDLCWDARMECWSMEERKEKRKKKKHGSRNWDTQKVLPLKWKLNTHLYIIYIYRKKNERIKGEGRFTSRQTRATIHTWNRVLTWTYSTTGCYIHNYVGCWTIIKTRECFSRPMYQWTPYRWN